MLTSSGLLKLGDFGVAKVMAGTTVVDNMTCVGSPTYMAPEIVAGEAYGAPCDVRILSSTNHCSSPLELTSPTSLVPRRVERGFVVAQAALAAVCRFVAMALGPITTHALNTATGRPAENLQVTLKQAAQSPDEDGQIDWKLLKVARTNSDGRAANLGEGLQLSPGEVFELSFATSEYFKEQGTPCFYPVVRIAFEIQEAESHYHVPLLISPFGYSTYRGS
ncbi:Urah [Symbiodinium sp. CCMP2592]|nr:Urah [Symbiodinium sp. CCMP2592]